MITKKDLLKAIEDMPMDSELWISFIDNTYGDRTEIANLEIELCGTLSGKSIIILKQKELCEQRRNGYENTYEERTEGYPYENCCQSHHGKKDNR